MSQRFIKGRTYQPLTWVMVDATDGLTPESALSAATKIKIWGKLSTTSAVYFVSSGTGSMTTAIKHVGPSVLGLYTINLAKADLSDLSAAWYDQYIVSLSATGAAYQTLVVDGGVLESYISNVASYLSNLQSNLSGVVSDIRSDVSDMHSDLLVMSGILSDVYSLVGAGASASNIAAKVWSDYESKAGATPSQVYSVLLLAASRVSDMQSYLTVMSGVQSDLYSLLSDTRSTTDSQFAVTSNYLSYLSTIVSTLGGGATPSAIAAKVWSDYTSQVGATPSQAYSVLHLAASRVSDIQSFLTVMSGVQSDAYSLLSDTRSTMDSQFAVVRTYLSQLSGVASDAYSALVALSDAVSNVDSALTSQYSDLESKLTSQFVATSSLSSDLYSLLSDTRSTMESQFAVTSNYLSNLSAMVSDTHSAAHLAASYASTAQTAGALTQSMVSDIYSYLTASSTEPGQGTPPVAATDRTKLGYIYKSFRNKVTQTASEYALYAADGTTKDQRATTSDDGAVFTRGEVQTGP